MFLRQTKIKVKGNESENAPGMGRKRGGWSPAAGR